MAAHPGILAWKILSTKEPGKLHSPWGHKESDMNQQLNNMYCHTCYISIDTVLSSLHALIYLIFTMTL